MGLTEITWQVRNLRLMMLKDIILIPRIPLKDLAPTDFYYDYPPYPHPLLPLRPERIPAWLPGRTTAQSRSPMTGTPPKAMTALTFHLNPSAASGLTGDSLRKFSLFFLLPPRVPLLLIHPLQTTRCWSSASLVLGLLCSLTCIL